MFDVKYPTLDSVGLCLNFHKLTISNIIHVHWPIIKDVNTRSATIFPKISLAILNDVIPITKLIRNHLMPMEIYMLSLCLFNNKVTRRPIVTQYCIKRFNTAFNVYFNPACVWGLWCRRQMSRADIGICIPQYPLGCDCLSAPVMPPPGTGDLIHMHAYVNPLRAKLFKGNKNIYLHFMSFLHIDLTQVLKILPQLRAGSSYSI